MEMVVNELSFAETDDEFEAKFWYETFFDLCQEIEKEYKIKISLKSSSSLKDLSFNDKIPFLKWISAQSTDIKRSILSMLTKAQFIHDYPYYKVFDEEGKGIGYAFENEMLLLSFITKPEWKNNFLSIIQEKINEEENEIEELEKSIRNGYDSNFKKFHNQFIKEKIESLRKKIYVTLTGEKLWEQRGELFPSLIFCESTQNNFSGLGGRHLQLLIKRLQQYEDYFSVWIDGDFDVNIEGGASLESDTRIRTFKNELTIKCPDGNNRLFSLHCRYGIKGFRMHFFPDLQTRKCIIGYVGKKII